MMKQGLRLSAAMKESAKAPAPHSAEAIMESIINNIWEAGLPFEKLTVVSPTSTSLRLKCEMPLGYMGIKKTMIAVQDDGATVNVRRDIDPGQDTVVAFDKVVIKGLSLQEASKRVIAEIRKMNGWEVQPTSISADRPASRM